MNVKEKVIEFFNSKGGISEKSDIELDCNYLEIGLIDSMQLVEMIVLFEDEFKIKFTTENLQSMEFRTIGGLINLINKLCEENKN